MKLLLTPAWNGTYEPTTLLMVLVCVGPALVLIWIALAVAAERGWLPAGLACAVFHRRHHVVTHTVDGDFVKCDACGRTHGCQRA